MGATPPPRTQEEKDAFNQQVMSDRTRTIDQIKRLYAVVMGFAVTACFSNVYACMKIVGISSTVTITLIAQVVSFLTLIVLFYLGTERLFDNRYLRVESHVPSRFGLLMDLSTSGATAIWFVILADTFPDPMKYNTPAAMEVALGNNIKVYTAMLLLLYIADTIFLVIQIIRTMTHKTGDYNLIIENHVFWLLLNVLGVLLLFPVIKNFSGHPIVDAMVFMIPTWVTPVFQNPVYLSLYILVLHLGRFVADYWVAFHSYYPPQKRET